MAMWNPWRGCRRVSEGCKYCFLFMKVTKNGRLIQARLKNLLNLMRRSKKRKMATK
ncbi:Phage protein Gp37/Gp68 [Enterococcus faecium]|uniref:Phage protein Gp37/Gp68 n=1 Tax=Enterococcus raffinosus ATCC 49464 TaxID=1158602 RepID=A0ABN0M7N3_9ENTE|nr:hypothetical protein I590_01514 [Enterococcus raffinosus ATCC 49464]SAM80713.1 Phage protein Gp37/Gp68 [Enterococcus faecium]